MNKYISRITSSNRGESFNVLSWLFLIPTFLCGVAMLIAEPLSLGGTVGLIFNSLNSAFPLSALGWGFIATMNITLGTLYLLFRFPPIGKTSGIIGFMLWLWAGFWFILSQMYFVALILALPQAVFWIWQYLTLSRFSSEESLDDATMARYNNGEYDDKLNPVDSKRNREQNRGA